MHFEQAAELVTPEQLGEMTPCGPDVERFVEHLAPYLEAGIDNVYLHQIGPDQEGFFAFWRDELQPALAKLGGGGRRRQKGAA